MSDIINVEVRGVRGIDWQVAAHPSEYHEAVRDHFASMPGCKWVRPQCVWAGPTEAVQLVLAKLEAAGVVATKWRVPSKASMTLPDIQATALRQYQRDGVAWLHVMLRDTGAALLADDMGLGKTLQAIVAAELHSPQQCKLVIAPAIAVQNWRRQLQLWSTEPLNWYVVSYDTFRSLWGKFRVPHNWFESQLLVLDEGHYLSNRRSKRCEAVREFIAAQHKRPAIIGLTGTPITAYVRDMWQLLDILHPGRWGTKWQFERRYAGGHDQEIRIGAGTKTVWVADGATNMAELHHRLQSVMLRRLKAEVAAELPSRERVMLELELPKAAAVATRKGAKLLKRSTTIAADFALLLGLAEANKLDAAAELARECLASGGRPLLLTLRRESAERLANMLMCPVAHGEVEAAERQNVLLSGGGAAVSTIYAVTTAIDLVEFDTIIFVGLDWRPSTLLQAESRAHRIGQTRPVKFYYLVGCGTVDEVIRERVLSRLDEYYAALGGDASGGMATTLKGGTDEDLLAALAAAVMA